MRRIYPTEMRPSHDILAFCDADSVEGLAELRDLIARIKNGDHMLSPERLVPAQPTLNNVPSKAKACPPFRRSSQIGGHGANAPLPTYEPAQLANASLFSRLHLLDRAAAVGPVLEAADVIDMLVTHVLEQFAGQRGASAGCAVENDVLVLGEILVV